MKLGIAGAGMIVQEALPVLKSLHIELRGIWARPKSEAKLQELAKLYDIKAYYTDYDMMLEDMETDTVYIAVPNIHHYAFAKKALEAGKNVICEKPFTSNVGELSELRDLAEDKGLILLEAITTCYLPAFQQIKDVVESEKMGRIHLARVNFSQYSSRYDKFKQGIIAPVFDPAQNGGSLMDLNIYNIHFLCGLFGIPTAVEYFPVMEKGVDTSGVLILRFGSTLAVSMASKASDCESFVELQGEKASLILESPVNALGDFCIFQKGKGREFYDTEDVPHRMTPEFRAFRDIIDNKDYMRASEALEHSVEVMKIITKAREFLK